MSWSGVGRPSSSVQRVSQIRTAARKCLVKIFIFRPDEILISPDDILILPDDFMCSPIRYTNKRLLWLILSIGELQLNVSPDYASLNHLFTTEYS